MGPVNGTPSRAEVRGKVARTKSALQLAVQNERIATDHVQALAKKVDVAHAALKVARKRKREDREAQAAFADAEFELDVERQNLGNLRRRRVDAVAALQEAERELDEFNRTVELAEAPNRFEETAGKAHTVLTALSGGAIAAGLRVSPPGEMQAWGLLIAVIGAALGLFSYVPQFIASAVDAVRNHSGRYHKGSLLISWHGGIQVIRLITLVLLVLCVVAAWILLLLAFFAPPGGNATAHSASDHLIQPLDFLE